MKTSVWFEKIPPHAEAGGQKVFYSVVGRSDTCSALPELLFGWSL